MGNTNIYDCGNCNSQNLKLNNTLMLWLMKKVNNTLIVLSKYTSFLVTIVATKYAKNKAKIKC